MKSQKFAFKGRVSVIFILNSEKNWKEAINLKQKSKKIDKGIISALLV